MLRIGQSVLVAAPPLPEPVPAFLPPGFVGWPDETLDGEGVWFGAFMVRAFRT